MKEHNGLCFLSSHKSFKLALKHLLGCSNNQMKKCFSSKELDSSINNQEEVQIPIKLRNIGIVSVSNKSSLKIVSEDENVLVLKKPCKLHCHPMNFGEVDNALSELRFLRSDGHRLFSINKEKFDKGLLYRLDYETSGILIYIKNANHYSKLRNNFKLMVKKKIYLAVVEGEVTSMGKVTDHIIGSGPKGSKMKVDPAGDLAELEILDSKYNKKEDKTLLVIRLYSGLRHQIRIQLKNMGNPIVGDILYEGREGKRLYLHAYSYDISELGGWTVEPDEDFIESFGSNDFLSLYGSF
jgi:23S rRNA pseudouridine1911/1915/1917 synthase